MSQADDRWSTSDRRSKSNRSSWTTDSGSLQQFQQDEKGLADQIDFLNAMVVFIFAFGLFLFAAVFIVDVSVDSTPPTDKMAESATERLSEDLLVQDGVSNDLRVDISCGFFYFAELPYERCGTGYIDNPDLNETQWVQQTLSLRDNIHANVTTNFEDSDPDNVGVIGPDIPTDRETSSSSRLIEGENDIAFVEVVVWVAESE